ncbi:MAG TPA: sirohydrochlorin cobaltochelatase [Longilinea sp.]|nr:sirohydrochlorin cobaltochelatase [Longilinea sp.]
MNKKALLVISFGTSHTETREKSITATENVLARAFPEHDLRRAFTSHVVIKKLGKRDDIAIDSVTQAVEKLYLEGYKEVLAQPLHVINGAEYHSGIVELMPYLKKFTKVSIGRPLLTHHQDYVAIVDALRDELPETGPNEAVIFMGHGSQHPANSAYSELDYVFKDEGFPHVHIGTVEGFPTLDSVIKRLEAENIKKVTLLPFMFVAGDHAQNDMAGDEEDSWKTILEDKGYTVVTRLVGLGEIEKIRQIYVDHARAALDGGAA